MKIKPEVYKGIKVYFRRHKKFNIFGGFTAGSDRTESYILTKDGSVGLTEYGINKYEAFKNMKKCLNRK